MEAKAIIHVQHRSWPKSELLLNKTTHPNGIITAISWADGYSYERWKALKNKQAILFSTLTPSYPMTRMTENIQTHYFSPAVFLLGPDFISSLGWGPSLLSSISKWRNCLFEKVNTVNYTPHKDECPCEIEAGFHKLSPNRVDRFESLMLPLLFFEACSMKRFEHDHF